jgi:EAL domain-containing protein (putative c-di-GMP-specific phosphodiesterase class I)
MCVDMDSNPKQQDIIRTFVSLATSLNKKTIIKWQHQDAVLDLLKGFGVDYIDDH